MVTAESLCCGTPIAGFKAGAPETISIPEYSKWVEYGDIKSLRNAVLEILKMDINKDELSNLAKTLYDRKVMVENYINVYKRLLK